MNKDGRESWNDRQIILDYYKQSSLCHATGSLEDYNTKRNRDGGSQNDEV